jgi:hypothetical protein
MCEVAEMYVEAHGLDSFITSGKFHKPVQNFGGKNISKPPENRSQPPASNKSGKTNNIKCYNCGSTGHYQFQCKEPKIAGHIAKGMQSINWKKLIAEEVDKGVKDALKPIKSEAQPEASGCM